VLEAGGEAGAVEQRVDAVGRSVREHGEPVAVQRLESGGHVGERWQRREARGQSVGLVPGGPCRKRRGTRDLGQRAESPGRGHVPGPRDHPSHEPLEDLVPERVAQRFEVEQRAEGVEGDRVRLHASELPGVVLP
jgi:hypothetical protein